MEKNRLRLVKGVFSATLLTGVVLLSVLVTQPKALDKPASPPQQTALGQPQTAAKASEQPQLAKSIADQQGVADQRTNQTRVYQVRQDGGSRAGQPAKPAHDFTYTVKQGDTLYDLSQAYGISVDLIMEANGLASDKLSLDQKLLIPASGKVTKTKTTAKPVKTNKQVQAKAGIKTAAEPKTKPVSRSRYTGKAVGDLTNWSKVKSLFAIGEVAKVIDVNTGYTFQIKRKGGHNHADCEPLTSADTAVMKKLYGTWSWNRRAVVVVIDGKMTAASMAGMPHGSETVSGNGFSGHFDLHFYGSMTHGSEYTRSRTPMVDPDHQAMVRKAAGM